MSTSTHGVTTQKTSTEKRTASQPSRIKNSDLFKFIINSEVMKNCMKFMNFLTYCLTRTV